MRIKDIHLKVILDSRGQSTLEAEFFAELKGETKSVISSVPSGKSKGSYEVVFLEPQLALEKFNQVKEKILARDFVSQKEFDDFLISLDGTSSKKILGGNLILVLSMGFARLSALFQGIPLYQYLRKELEGFEVSFIPVFPFPFFNVINGGAHSGLRNEGKNFLDFQEFQIIPQVKDYSVGLSVAQEFYKKLQRFLEEKFSKDQVFLGDEAGFSCPFSSNEEALEIIFELIKKAHYPLKIGLDIAASQIFEKGGYRIGGKLLSSSQLADYYKDLINRYEIISIEDPFFEDSFDDFSNFLSLFKDASNFLVIADDLTVTNKERLTTAITKKSANAILIKLTQIGTVSEALEVVAFAYKNNWKAVVSHRSGETLDDFIADFAVGIGAWGIKAGAPAKPERMAKYYRLLEIWQEINQKS